MAKESVQNVSQAQEWGNGNEGEKAGGQEWLGYQSRVRKMKKKKHKYKLGQVDKGNEMHLSRKAKRSRMTDKSNEKGKIKRTYI